ncbi:MAG: pseudouridine synthase [Verrucomicrobiota bacterium]
MAEETLRLNRYLALAGLGSRRACDVLIANGEVEINGRIVTNLGTQVQSSDDVWVGGKQVSASRLQTIVLHKPPGVHCTRHDPKGRPTVYSLVAPQHKKLHYVGRLDADSEGLLVMTNDGDLTQQLTHPSHKVEKEYVVTVDRPCRSERIAELLAGIPLEEGLAKAEAIHVISPRRLVMVLQQGMNRQIRRMFQHMDYEVERLIRVRIGNLVLPDLKMGKWRVLEPKEIAKLTETYSRRKSPPPADNRREK